MPSTPGTASIAEATSRRKQADSSDAATAPTAAASRVFERPDCGALQMIPIAAPLMAGAEAAGDQRRSRSIAARHDFRQLRPSQNRRQRAPFDLSYGRNTARAFVGLVRMRKAQRPPFQPPSGSFRPLRRSPAGFHGTARRLSR